MTSPTDLLARQRPDPNSYIPGFRITYGELERACEYLVGQGWAGLLSFDEAVRSLGPDEPRKDDEGGMDVE